MDVKKTWEGEIMLLNCNKKKLVHFQSLKRGEEIISKISAILKETNISIANIYVAGGVENVTLYGYDQKSRKKIQQSINKTMRIISMTGNAILKKGKLELYLHGTLARNNTNIIGGHIICPTTIFEGHLFIFQLA